jgi:hypothetical protein
VLARFTEPASELRALIERAAGCAEEVVRSDGVPS